MAEAKNNFIKSKMNKDLDDRLVPAGEYRHAQNIAVAKSEGQDVGALENILGNNLISNFLTPLDRPIDMPNVEIIGHFMDVKNDRIIVFMTNYTDTSSDALSNFSPIGAEHYIGVYNVLNSVSNIVVHGRFLNFSKTHEIYGVNVIDDLLFWTDNRNQPRKINLSKCDTHYSTHYTTEDTISVSKYYPHKTIDLIRNEVVKVVSDVWCGYTPSTTYLNQSTIIDVGDPQGFGLTVDYDTDAGGCIILGSVRVNQSGSGYGNGQFVRVSPNWDQMKVTTEYVSTMRDVVSDFLPDGITPNPYRQPYPTGDITWRGNPEYLKDKFVRFSYRFKFEDGEYSLIAPFTQTCFVPKQDGYFLENDDAKTFKSTEVDFVENKINDITLVLSAPNGDRWSNIHDTMKIIEIDILYKEAGQNTIKVVDTVTWEEFALFYWKELLYSYASTKPWKTLPDKEILRVHDQVPVRALSQELVGNRIVYGNYIDKPTPPTSISYSLSIDEKEENTQIEYQNQNLKQNRTYQVGIVLSDRYGRQSSTILSSIDDSTFALLINGSSIFHDYKKDPFSTYPTGGLYGPNPVTGDDDVWDGDALELQFWDTISSTKNSGTGEPGLYDEITNPLGWYTYKIVVKQEEQDYYNIYFPGILNGYIDGEALSTQASEEEPICHFVLAGDNINKVPRDLSLIGPNQTIFRTGRPSAQEDPSYYQFVDSSGLDFTVDPFSKEGERLLKERDRKRDLDSGSQITNASVKLSLRLNNTVPDTSGASTLVASDTTTHQAYPGTNLDVVTTVGTGSELGLWDPSAIMPFNTANVFYGYKNNPHVAKTNVSDPTGTGLAGPHPLSGTLDFVIDNIVSPTATYTPGSKNVPCKITDPAHQISGFLVNIDATVPTGGGNIITMSVANAGMGWDPLAEYGFPINAKVTGAGDADATFTITPTRTHSTPAGKMAPSLAVYETQPLKSKLDIFWETSTNGLIDELNTAIIEGDTTTPVGFMGYTQPDIAWDHKENMDIGTDITPSAIMPKAPDGSAINGPNHATLLSVIDGDNVDRISEFTLENHPNESFSIETNSYFMCDVDNNTKGEFTFNINIQVPGPTFVNDGLYIDANLPLGPYTLENMPPVFTTPMLDNMIATDSRKDDVFIWEPQGLGGAVGDWNEAAPPFTNISSPDFDTAIIDTNGSFNSTNGIYTCTQTGFYNITVNVPIDAEFQIYSGYWYLSEGVDMWGNLYGEIYINKNPSGGGPGVVVDMKEILIGSNKRFHSNGFKDPWGVWSWHGICPATPAAPYNGLQGGVQGYVWNDRGASVPQRADGKWYKLSANNYFLTAGDELRVRIRGMFVGGYEASSGRYGRSFGNESLNFETSWGAAKMKVGDPYLGSSTFAVAATDLEATTSSGSISLFNALNGSYDTPANSLKTDSLTFALDNDYSGLFYLDNLSNGNVNLLKNSGGIAGEAYNLKIIATDCAGSGLSTDLDFVVILT